VATEEIGGFRLKGVTERDWIACSERLPWPICSFFDYEAFDYVNSHDRIAKIFKPENQKSTSMGERKRSIRIIYWIHVNKPIGDNTNE